VQRAEKGGVNPTKVYLDAPYVSVRWESPGQWVFVQWMTWANSPDFRAAQEIVLEAIQETRTSRLLLDHSDAKLVLVDDERWIVESWLPRLAVTGVRWTAVIDPVNKLAKTIADDLAKATRINRSQTIHFESLETARSWLSSKV
jgi:hypothetical protein